MPGLLRHGTGRFGRHSETRWFNGSNRKYGYAWSKVSTADLARVSFLADIVICNKGFPSYGPHMSLQLINTRLYDGVQT